MAKAQWVPRSYFCFISVLLLLLFVGCTLFFPVLDELRDLWWISSFLSFRFLDKATVEDELDYECKTTRNWWLCIVQDVEDVKAILGLSPIWMSCLIFGVVFAQSSTIFTKQGATMDRKIGKHFEISVASLQGFISLSIVYDRTFVPIARNLTGNEWGITFLQRIGIGMFISIVSIIVVALIEIRRIKRQQRRMDS